MRRKSFFHLNVSVCIWFLVLLGILGPVARNARASVVINEILADPPAGSAGDANGDGVGSSTQDEFVELLNLGPSLLDLSGWYLNDALLTRHVFPVGSELLAYHYLVVFGGGTPSLAGVYAQTASSGLLSLNNTSEDVFLYNISGQLVDHFSYGTQGGKDQSLVRDPEGIGAGFVLHSTVPVAEGNIYSPGRSVEGQESLIPPTVATPELPGMVTMGSAFGAMLLAAWRRRLGVG